MKKKQKIQLGRAVASGLLLLAAALLPIPSAPAFVILMLSYLTAGYDTLLTAVRNIFHGQVFDENFLMALATVGAIALSDYKEAVFVMLFYLVGTIFEEYAVNKSRGSISSLMEIHPDYANPVSYTHLDVYKRQYAPSALIPRFRRCPAAKITINRIAPTILPPAIVPMMFTTLATTPVASPSASILE